MRDLRGRTALITGASAGIGKSVARALAQEGMNVVLAARSADKLRILARSLESLGVRAVDIPTDVSDFRVLQQLVERSAAEFGTIDLLVNNAGVEAFQNYHDLDVAEITTTIDVNLTASLVLARMVLPHMLRQGEGHIVNMSSTAGKHGPAYGAAYGASKAGLIAFTQSLRGEYHGKGISASVICPGFTRNGGIYDRIRERTGRTTPALMGSTTDDDVARAVIRAVRKDLPEVIVNRPPMRPLFVVAQMFPSLAEWGIRKVSSRFLKRVVTSRNRPLDAVGTD